MAESIRRPSCPACGGKRLQRYCERGDYHLVRCGGCGLVFVQEIVPPNVLEEHYNGQSRDRFGEHGTQLHEQRNRVLDQIEAVGIPGRTLLDIGCGLGQFLELARERGFAGVGIEVDRDRVALCRSRGLDVMQGWFPNPDLETESYDVVWASHVIEHVQYPRAFVKEIARVLKPGGVVCILTPNSRSVSARVCRCHHRYVIPPEHLTYWSARPLARFMVQAGFTSERAYSWNGHLQLKEVAAYVTKGQFARRPDPMPSTVPFVAGKGKTVGFFYRAIMVLSNLADPIMERFGGNELVGLFRKPGDA